MQTVAFNSIISFLGKLAFILRLMQRYGISTKHSVNMYSFFLRAGRLYTYMPEFSRFPFLYLITKNTSRNIISSGITIFVFYPLRFEPRNVRRSDIVVTIPCISFVYYVYYVIYTITKKKDRIFCICFYVRLYPSVLFTSVREVQLWTSWSTEHNKDISWEKKVLFSCWKHVTVSYLP